MVFDHWDQDPLLFDLYKNPYILFFDIISLPISCMVLTAIFIIWNYRLYFAKTGQTNATKKTLIRITSVESVANNGKSKIKTKVNISLPTLTAPDLPSSSNESEHIQEIRANNKEKDETKQHQSIHWIAKLLTTITITLALLFSCFLTLIVILSLINYHPKCIYIALCFELIYTQRLCLYLYYIFRAYISFKNTVYKFNKKRILFAAITISCLWIFGELFFLIWDSIINSFDHYCTEIVSMIAIIPLCVAEFCVAAFCVTLFVFNLKKVNSREKLRKNNGARFRLQYLVTKLTILSTVTILSTFTILSLFPFTFALGLLAIDTPINVICLMLSFGIYDKYYKQLCSPCRNCCEKKRPDRDISNIIKA